MNGKRIGTFLFLLLPALGFVSGGHAGTLSWENPTTYADGTPMAAAQARTIIVEVYAGPTKRGPWSWVATSLPGATSATVMDPQPGETLWYTVRATLPGAKSAFAPPVRKSDHTIVVPPAVKRVAKALYRRRKGVLPAALLLLAGLAGFLAYRRWKGKG